MAPSPKELCGWPWGLIRAQSARSLARKLSPASRPAGGHLVFTGAPKSGLARLKSLGARPSDFRPLPRSVSGLGVALRPSRPRAGAHPSNNDIWPASWPTDSLAGKPADSLARSPGLASELIDLACVNSPRPAGTIFNRPELVRAAQRRRHLTACAIPKRSEPPGLIVPHRPRPWRVR